MAELYTLTGTNVATEVKAQFGEEGDVQITDAHVLRWINRGQREIAVRTRFLKSTVTKDLVAGTPTYDLGVDRLLQLDSVFVNGLPLSMMSVQEADSSIRYLDPQGTASGSQPEAGWLDNGILNLYPNPSASVTGGLRVKVIAYPADLTAIANTLTIPDRLFNQLVTYCLAQAQYLDANPEQHQRDIADFEQGLARQSEIQNAGLSSAFQQIQGDPDDGIYSTGDGYFD
jgi:hypothetical protein